jgi:two-component system, cell cycle response regulator
MMDFDDTVVIRQLAAPSKCNVLVVDDDELVRAKIGSLLRLAGYQVHCAASGAQALLILGNRPCEIVLTDWEMPDMDGPSLCKALRLRDVERYTYVLMLSIRNGPADILGGLHAGVDDYVVKGAPAEELLARVEVGRRITHLEHALRISSAENRRLSVTDALTGAHNRRYLMKYLPRELARARRYGHPIAILSCDIDEFKGVNDCFGHEAGDQVLQAFVARALTCTRVPIDWIARAGGEEFIVVLPETPLDGASTVAEKVRIAMAANAIPTCAGPVSAKVSIGVTALETAEELAGVPMAELLRAADHCLYASKSRGRDRSTCLSLTSANGLSRAGALRGRYGIN